MNAKPFLPLLAVACMLCADFARAGPMTILDPGGGAYSLHLTSLKEARFKRTIRQRYDFSCGSAAVATLLTYQYDYPMNEEMAFEQMFAHGNQEKIRREGFSLLDMKRFLEARGFVADGFELPLEKLEQTHTPGIVLFNEKGYHHFVVVKGLRGNRVLIGDPATGTRALSRDSFAQKWDNGVLFVIHNKHELSTFNDPSDWRVAPSAPIFTAIDRSGLQFVAMPKHGPSDF